MNNPVRWLVFLLLIVGVSLFLFENETALPSITAEDVQKKIAAKENILLLDVRTEEEFSEGHLANATLIPLQELNERTNELEQFKEKEIIVYCRSGNRSKTATTLLKTKGFRAMNMEGGIRQWNGTIVQ
jgi:rhodanese-related sulfurtransferase